MGFYSFTQPIRQILNVLFFIIRELSPLHPNRRNGQMWIVQPVTVRIIDSVFFKQVCYGNDDVLHTRRSVNATFESIFDCLIFLFFQL